MEALMLLYEFLPPVSHTGSHQSSSLHVKRSAQSVCRFLKGFKVDGVYLPQIVEEEIRGDSAKVERPKRIDARMFGKAIVEENPGFEVLITQVFPHLKNEIETHDWVKSTFEEYLIRNLVVVGKSHSGEVTTGFNVSQALTWLVKNYHQASDRHYAFGAIAIEHRQHEARNMLNKTLAGAGFFTTQIFYDSQAMLSVLKEYKMLCDASKIKPARVFLSVSPLSSKLDLKVMTALLGYQLPQKITEYIFDEKAPNGTEGNRSIEVVLNVIKDLFAGIFIQGQNTLGVPLGICVCHVTERNHRYALELLSEMDQFREFLMRHG